ncbi:MAG: hypothetical protein M1829_000484 [Trizodia sp. TS-e1964]|nr:MAG: hypothetical protein M1829_000484 [Trizodia sp. TS-e1964]
MKHINELALTPSAHGIVTESIGYARYNTVELGDQESMEARVLQKNGNVHIVNIRNRYCSCLKFQEYNPPCGHVISVIYKLGLAIPEDIIDSYWIGLYQCSYDENVTPINISELQVEDLPAPPPPAGAPGRPTSVAYKTFCSQDRGIVDLFSITKPPSIPSILDQKLPATPLTCCVVRRFQKLYKKSPSKPSVRILFSANERLAAENSINIHIIKGLTAALQNEKKKRKRGKRLNLVGEEDSGPQFFSPGRITAARAFQEEKDQIEELRRQGIETRKRKAASKKAEKEKEKLLKAAATMVKQKLAAKAKAAKAAQVEARKEQREKAAMVKKASLRIPRSPIGTPKACKLPKEPNNRLCKAVASREEEVVQMATSRGRAVKLPGRYAF